MSKDPADVVLAALAARPGPWFVLELEKATSLHAGDIYPALARLEGKGWVTSDWAPSEGDAPRRRRYSINTLKLTPGD